MGQRLERLVTVGGADDDDLCPADTVHIADDGQTAAFRRLVDEDECTIVLTFSDGCCEGFCQIFGNDNLLRIHLSMLMVAYLLLMLQR